MKRIIIATLFAATLTPFQASANCGNGKDVGNGCNGSTVPVSQPVTVSPSFTTTTNNNVGVNNNVQTSATSNSNSSAVGISDSRSSSIATGVGGNGFGGSSSVQGVQSQATVGNVTGGNASATGGNSTSTSAGGSATATGGAGGSSSAVSTSAGGTGGNGGNSTSQNNLTFNTVEAQRPVSSAVAPTIIHSGGQDTCMGSSSASVQGMSLGVAVGSTWTDKHCEALRASVRLNELGLKRTAMARLCAIPEIASAFRISGEFDCGQ